MLTVITDELDELTDLRETILRELAAAAGG